MSVKDTLDKLETSASLAIDSIKEAMGTIRHLDENNSVLDLSDATSSLESALDEIETIKNELS